MAKQNPEHGLPPEAVQLLKQQGFIERATPATQAVLRCATCPFADSKFYASRAIDCSSLPSGTVVPITRRLYQARVLENRRVEETDLFAGRPPRVLYDVNPVVIEAVQNSQPLPGCKKVPQA